jgi:hypothetical protein
MAVPSGQSIGNPNPNSMIGSVPDSAKQILGSSGYGAVPTALLPKYLQAGGMARDTFFGAIDNASKALTDLTYSFFGLNEKPQNGKVTLDKTSLTPTEQMADRTLKSLSVATGMLGTAWAIPSSVIAGATKIPIVSPAAKIVTGVLASPKLLTDPIGEKLGSYLPADIRDEGTKIIQDTLYTAALLGTGKIAHDTYSDLMEEHAQKIEDFAKNNAINNTETPQSTPNTTHEAPTMTPETSKPISTTIPSTKDVNAPEMNKIEQTTTSASGEKTTKPEVISQPEKGMVNVRTAKSASDISQTMAEKGFEQLPEEEKAKYSPTTKAETLQKVSDIMKNPDDALARIRGKVNTENAVRQPLWNAMERQAMENNDGEMIKELSKSPLASKRSLSAQELGSAGFNQNPHSPVEAVREITQAREADYLKKSGQTVVKAKSDIVKSEGENMAKEIKKSASSKQNWESFINQLSCKS